MYGVHDDTSGFWKADRSKTAAAAATKPIVTIIVRYTRRGLLVTRSTMSFRKVNVEYPVLVEFLLFLPPPYHPIIYGRELVV